MKSKSWENEILFGWKLSSDGAKFPRLESTAINALSNINAALFFVDWPKTFVLVTTSELLMVERVFSAWSSDVFIFLHGSTCFFLHGTLIKPFFLRGCIGPFRVVHTNRLMVLFFVDQRELFAGRKPGDIFSESFSRGWISIRRFFLRSWNFLFRVMDHCFLCATRFRFLSFQFRSVHYFFLSSWLLTPFLTKLMDRFNGLIIVF